MIETLLFVLVAAAIFGAGVLVGAHNASKVESRLAAVEADLATAKADADSAHDRIDKFLAAAKIAVADVKADAAKL